MTLLEVARLLAFIGARDGWAPSDHNVIAWHPGLDETSYGDAADRVLDHRPAHRISLACVLGNCDPRGPHDITTEESTDPVRHLREHMRWRREMAHHCIPQLTEADFTFMVQAVGPHALDIYRAAVATEGATT